MLKGAHFALEADSSTAVCIPEPPHLENTSSTWRSHDNKANCSDGDPLKGLNGLLALPHKRM